MAEIPTAPLVSLNSQGVQDEGGVSSTSNFRSIPQLCVCSIGLATAFSFLSLLSRPSKPHSDQPTLTSGHMSVSNRKAGPIQQEVIQGTVHILVFFLSSFLPVSFRLFSNVCSILIFRTIHPQLFSFVCVCVLRTLVDGVGAKEKTPEAVSHVAQDSWDRALAWTPALTEDFLFFFV